MIVKCGIQVNVHPDDEKTKRNIYMVKHFLTRTAPGIAAAAIFVALPLSCVNEEYDLEKIDTTVQFGGNALVFPLGSTEQLKLQTLLPENEYLQLLDLANEQVWGFKMSDEMDLSGEIPDLKGYLDIDDISINSDIDETLEIDLSNADIEETVFPDPDDPDAGDASISFEGMEMPDIDELLPGPGQIQPVDIEIGIADYYPDEEQLGLKLPEAKQSFHDILTQKDWNNVKNAVEASGVTGDVPISIGNVLPVSLDLPQGTETKVSVKIELPEGISNVRDVVFAEEARMHISLSLVNSFLAEGEVTPEISVAGLGDLVMIDDQSFDSRKGTLDLSSLILSAENPVAERDYVLTGLPDMKWTGNKLDAEVSVDASGEITFSNDVSTTANLIAAQSEMLGIDIDISFTGTMIADMTMDVEPLVSNVNPDMDIAIGEIKLPSEVKSVERVDMNDNSGITMKISSENLSQISGLDAVLTNLQIKFPEALGFGTYPAGQQGTFDEASRTLTVENADLTEDMEIFMPVEAILPPEPETSLEGDRIIAFDGKVIVEASYSAGGKGISLSELPTEGGEPVNAGIVKSVVESVLKYSPNAIILMVSNPMDTMTYLALKAAGIPKRRVIGMGGALDSSRFRCYLSKASGAGIQDIDGMVIGGHGDTTMIPLVSKASIKGVPVTKLISKKKLAQVVADTMVGGATLTKLLGTSAWYAPGVAGASVVDAIINDTKAIIPCSVYLEGEYGQNDICIGVPVVLGRKGIEKIVKIDLTKEEAAKFAASADAVRKVNGALHEIGAL